MGTQGAAAKDFEIHWVDIKTDFLSCEFKDEVFVTQPPRYDNGIEMLSGD